ncbi:MAG: ABC transporter permease [Planctomycetes bacterium]|nr:ABC transporter permease [Planctomycetota bacterium]
MPSMVSELGFRATAFLAGLGELGRFSWAVARALLRPPPRAREALAELYKQGVLSVSIIVVAGLAVGMVLGLQGYSILSRFGAAESLGSVVGLSLLRELGPVLTALLVTGRAGSATTAEIGTMVATEQLDGLRMMSVDPVHYVVAPRALGLALVMPLLSALFITCGIFGGWVVGTFLMGLDSGRYLSSLQSNTDFHDDVVGSFVKASIFGVIVALVSTWRGYRAEPTSAGVSAATTSTVVTASLSILLGDYMITALWGL